MFTATRQHVLGSEFCAGKTYTQQIENSLNFRTGVCLLVTSRGGKLIDQRDRTENLIEPK
jgi:hypothetical protein